MSEHFIKDIEIKSYKLFKDFKASGFGRVNLIGGKNNVGKTAFMEACYISQAESVQELYARFLEVKTHRDIVNNLLSRDNKEEDIKKLVKSSVGVEIIVDFYNKEDEFFSNLITNNIVNISFDKDNGLYKYDLHKIVNNMVFENLKKDTFLLAEITNSLYNYLHSTKYRYSTSYISIFSNSNEELKNIIGELKLNKKYDKLNSYLKSIFNIDTIDIIKDKPLLEIKDNYLELTEFGQGIKSFINIIASLLLLEDNYIFIDELENGIHYTNYDKLWEIILTLSKQHNVQVFATTHSKECIESFNRVQKQQKDNETYYFEMYRNVKNNKIEMRALGSEQLEYELTHNGRFRGE